jgi:hypothetical protein
MIDLSTLRVAEKEGVFEHPFGFKVKLAYLPITIEKELAKRALVRTVVRGQMSEDVDLPRYYKTLVPKIVKGWEGLTVGHLKRLVPISTIDSNDDEVIPYSSDNAIFLVQNSENFDKWVQDTRSDLERFSELEEAEKNSPFGLKKKPSES